MHLSAGLNAKSNWVRALPDAMRSLNVTRSSSRGASPFELMFGTKPNYAAMRRIGMLANPSEPPVPATPETSVVFADELGARIDAQVTHANALRDQRQAANARQQALHGKPRDIHVGDFVMVANLEGTESTAIENKQRQGGPYEVINIDATLRRATLRRCADQTTLPTAVTFNRLQRVDRDAVLTPIAPSNEPGAPVWTGVSDTSLLLPTEKVAADKALTKQRAAAAAAEKERQAEIARNEARQRRDEAAQQRRREERDRIAAATRQREQLALDRATVEIPAGAVPIGILHHVGGKLITLTTDINDRHNASKWLIISSDHRRYNEFDEQWRRAQRPPRQRQQQRAPPPSALRRRVAKAINRDRRR